ncbi:BglG family transcription antiterminator [Salipaludibacillus sp. CUR1]|uniref:BglG family transcription antiterminator n=1 Tax=Salipaludibacillus sp. CUR1 TaxID=2820003 RepID=UPI00351D8E15
MIPMYVSARDKFILEMLIKHSEGVTIRDIAHSLQVSERTIHRDVATFDSLLLPYELTLEKIAGKGIFLKGAKEQIKQFSQDLQEAKHFDFLPEQRQVIIICKLLESFEPVKLQSFAVDLNVTVATITNDLEKVDEWLVKYDLELERRRGLGIQITGSETDKRKAISGLLSENFEEGEILKYIRRKLPNQDSDLSESIAGQLLGFINIDKLKKVEESVKKIIRTLDYQIADSAYIALVVHLTLALERISKGENISINTSLAEHLKNKKEYKLAEKLAMELKKSFSLDIPEAEIGYITMHLRGAKLHQDHQVLFTEDNLDTVMVAKKLINEVSNRTEVDFNNDHSLYQGLMAHLEPALYRLKQGMHIHNPLQEKIQATYPDLFSTVKQAFKSVLTKGMTIPDEEIGFLVLHFGSAMERENNRRTHKAVVICSSGIGSSKMIASRLQSEFPNITEVKNSSLFELDKFQPEELDLVISTIPLVDHSVDYVQVNPFLTKDDVAKIQDYIDRREHFYAVKQEKPALKNSEKQDTSKPRSPVKDIFSNLQKSLSASAHLLRNFHLYEAEQGSGLWDSLLQVVCKLKDDRLVADEHEVIKSLKKRAELSGLGIPETHIALFHTRNSSVIRPLFVILNLSEAVEVKAMDENDIEMKRVLIMLGPTDMTDEETEILSTISSAIIENERSISLFEGGKEQEISEFLSVKLLNFYQDYLKKENPYYE